ncbi:hypothetical protein R3P38DRAFT_3045220 [Favolaschia claudopus]|uniref:Syntaxin N-terminal domain-containing protein n=1 Tax=Favolaschia claudopus TaxID=2862362 RepID=A0AAW0A7S7_9AGAR
MVDSIEHFTVLLVDIRSATEDITHASRMSRFLRVAHHERKVQDIRTKLDNAYRDFEAASTLRVEFQQSVITVQQEELLRHQKLTGIGVSRVVEVTTELDTKISRIMVYSSVVSLGLFFRMRP